MGAPSGAADLGSTQACPRCWCCPRALASPCVTSSPRCCTPSGAPASPWSSLLSCHSWTTRWVGRTLGCRQKGEAGALHEKQQGWGVSPGCLSFSAPEARPPSSALGLGSGSGVFSPRALWGHNGSHWAERPREAFGEGGPGWPASGRAAVSAGVRPAPRPEGSLCALRPDQEAAGLCPTEGEGSHGAGAAGGPCVLVLTIAVPRCVRAGCRC